MNCPTCAAPCWFDGTDFAYRCTPCDHVYPIDGDDL